MRTSRMLDRRAALLGLAALGAACAAVPVGAKEYRVAMVNQGPEGAMAFSPGYLKVAPGDSVRFVSQDKGHNAESIPELTPKGVPTFKGAINQELLVTFRSPGLYGYKCLPHFGLGMVGLIQVGATANRADFTAQLGKLPPLAAKRMSGYLSRVR